MDSKFTDKWITVIQIRFQLVHSVYHCSYNVPYFNPVPWSAATSGYVLALRSSRGKYWTKTCSGQKVKPDSRNGELPASAQVWYIINLD